MGGGRALQLDPPAQRILSLRRVDWSLRQDAVIALDRRVRVTGQVLCPRATQHPAVLARCEAHGFGPQLGGKTIIAGFFGATRFVGLFAAATDLQFLLEALDLGRLRRVQAAKAEQLPI